MITVRHADLVASVPLRDVADAIDDYVHDVRFYTEAMNGTTWEILQAVKDDLEALRAWHRTLTDNGLDGLDFKGGVDDALDRLSSIPMHDAAPDFDMTVFL